MGESIEARIFEGLNPEQRRAVEAVRGPVCILAGAGTGKTTTITRRIANQVRTETFREGQILAVAFTKKAAEEMGRRLAELGAGRVRACTFHSAAARQLSYFTGERKTVIRSKFEIIGPIVRSLPKPHNKRALSDIATDIEWAKNRRLAPSQYEAAVEKENLSPPIPAELMAGVFREYETKKQAAGYIDYEDQLALTIRLFQDEPPKLEEFQAGYRAFTVDEYQDVNLLQQTLLDLWLGERDDLCVVGDDYQSIYGFTGATASHLLEMPARFENPTVVVLEHNYRSTPEVLEVANRLVPGLGGRKKVLRATVSSGPKPATRSFESNEDGSAFIARQIGKLHRDGVPLREMAVLYRLNYRSSLYEGALIRIGIPFQVWGGGFLERKAAKQVIPRLERRAFEGDVVKAVGQEIRGEGYLKDPPRDIGTAELAFQEDLALLLALAVEFDDDARTLGDFVSNLRDRFESESQRDAVQLMTYHSAKGLEFEAVFMPGLEEDEMPYWRSVKADTISEERRLFYVGLTRAKRHLYLTWSSGGKPKSRFLEELAPSHPTARARPSQKESRRTRRSRPGSGRARPGSSGPGGIVARVGQSIEWGSYQGSIESIDEAGVWMRVGKAKIHVRFGRRVSAGRRRGRLLRGAEERPASGPDLRV